jgi:Uma2 family endonuclease
MDRQAPTRGEVEMETEAFEKLAMVVARLDETFRVELLDGRVLAKKVPDGLHSEIVMWLQAVCVRHDPRMGLYADRGLAVKSYWHGRVVPDGTYAPKGHFLGAGSWADPAGVTMTVAVTSSDDDINQRDRIDKPRAYAESGIPVYLLIDRDRREVSIHSDPQDGAYGEQHVVPFGKTVTLPEPVGIELDTQQLLEWTEGAAAPES